NDAITFSAADYWEGVLTESANMFRGQIWHRSIPRFEKWNEIAVQMRSHVTPLVATKMERASQNRVLAKRFGDLVQWQVGHAYMESEYRDIVPLGFFSKLVEWLLGGHVACGWRGPFPGGAVLVF